MVLDRGVAAFILKPRRRAQHPSKPLLFAPAPVLEKRQSARRERPPPRIGAGACQNLEWF
jgi:hypothetical protein